MDRGHVFPLAMLVAVAACGDGVAMPPSTPAPASVTVTVSAVTPMTALGQTRTLTAVVRDANQQVMPDATVTWATDIEGAITLSTTTGTETVATAAGNGDVRVTAASADVTSVTHVLTVQQAPNTLTLSPAAPVVYLNETGDLTAAVLDANGNPITLAAPVDFSSSDDGVASVTPLSAATARITAVAEGGATITASYTADGTTTTATAAVTVAIPPTAATVQATALRTFEPPTAHVAAGGTVTWQYASATTSHNITFETPGSPENVPDHNATTAPDGNARTFPTVGTYNYRCTRHSGMSGAVVVH
jgi:adhesin/invasin